MPTLNKYASSNEKTGYFIRANVGGHHPITLQATGTAERILQDSGYSDGSTIPTKLVWSMYDVDLVYTESSVSSTTPSYSFDSLSDAVTGSELTEETRRDLIQYFGEYSGSHQTQVNQVLTELRRKTAADSIETYDSSEPVTSAKNLLREYGSENEQQAEHFLDQGEGSYESLLTFGQRASQIKDIELDGQSAIAYEISPLSVPGETTVHDLTLSYAEADSKYDYCIEYRHTQQSSVYVRNGSVRRVNGPSANLSWPDARQLAAEVTPVEIHKKGVESVGDAPAVSEVPIPDRAFIQGDSDLLIGVVDRISNSDNPLVKLEHGHLLLDVGEEDTLYLIDRVDQTWGRVLCELTHGDDVESTTGGDIPFTDENAFRDTEIKNSTVDAATSYHNHYQEITVARVGDNRFDYVTRALLPSGIGGPLCGFGIGLGQDNYVMVEVIADPEDAEQVLSYGDLGIRHRIMLTDEQTTWETAVSRELKHSRADHRDELLVHQAEILQIMKETLAVHMNKRSEDLIAEVVSSGDLEQRVKTISSIWKDRSLLGELLPTPERKQDSDTDQMASGTVDFFNDTGGYGFIETDAYDEDVFYHMEDVGGPDITEGEQLRFTITQAENGPRAENVERIK